MESYPDDLLVGVSPLVFAVNSIFVNGSPAELTNTATTETATAAATSDASGSIATKHTTRSLFDRFLDAMAASLIDIDDNEAIEDENELEFRTNPNTVSLFRPDEDDIDDSSDEELFIPTGSNIYGDDYNSKRPSFSFAALSPPSFRLGGRSSSTGNTATAAAGNTASSFTSIGDNTDPTYAKALTLGQGFFQRARIVSISSKHGFPPSKDPDGKQNLVHSITKNKSSIPKLRTLFSKQPIQGILPTGWLRKHVYALPSVVLVVVQLSEVDQDEQNTYLLHTLEHLHYSLVNKRECQIHVVCLVADDVSAFKAEQWSININRQIVESNRPKKTKIEPQHITLLRSSRDLHNSSSDGFPSSVALRRLHRSVKDTSYTYYLQQARRTKQKLIKLLMTKQQSSLSSSTTTATSKQQQRAQQRQSQQQQQQQQQQPKHYPNELLPLCVRYCFKIAIFYEFQWKHEKSIKFLAASYNHLQNYYRYLKVRGYTNWYNDYNDIKNESIDTETFPTSIKKAGSQSSSKQFLTSTTKTLDTEEGTEISMDTLSSISSPTGDSNTNNKNDNIWQKAVPPPPDDMVYQCRGVADWLNFKLLQAGFVSHTQDGLIAAAEQWRRHCQLFCTEKYYFVLTPSDKQNDETDESKKDNDDDDGNSIVDNEWYFWSQVAHQRLVMGQLLERHPPKALFEFGLEHDELLIRCCPWRTYKAVAEALLKVGTHTHKAMEKNKKINNNNNNRTVSDEKMRAPYVGGLDSHGLTPMLEEESRIDHREKALEFILRAILLFERENEREMIKLKDNDFKNIFCPHYINSRSGARLYYLAGGILVGANQHKQALNYLEKASNYTKEWSGLELAIRRLLTRCYEKCGFPSSVSSDGNEGSGDKLAEKSPNNQNSVVSTILDSCFNSQMSTLRLHRALGSFSPSSSDEKLKWYHEYVDEANSASPFAFTITFPGTTHATAGDTVNASILIKSNLDYAVHIKTVTLLSFAGPVPIPSSDLLSAKNVSEGNDGGIIIQPKTDVFLTTLIDLPKDLNDIAIDEGGGSTKSATGKNSFTKSARPRTAGITSAAGTRYLPENVFGAKPKVGNAQWSLSFLGGKSLRCDGLQLVFHPLHGVNEDGKLTLIELTIQKKKPETLVDIKRTPFEEDNYISSAWSRPPHLPLTEGPRCLRVLGPMSEMTVTNMTLPATGDRALEGTINRILLKLEAGPIELCNDIRYQVKCSNMLVTTDGKTIHLTEEESSGMEQGMTLYAKNPQTRTPVLVAKDHSSTASQQTEYGYSLPIGWSALNNHTTKVTTPIVSSLKGGEATYAYFDLYRPSPLGSKRSGVLSGVEQDIGEHALCQTDFEVKITYHQERPASQKQKRIKRGVRRMVSSTAGSGNNYVVDSSGGDTVSEQGNDGADANSKEETKFAADLVSLDFSGSVMWCAPLSASFSRGLKSSHPSGSRHHSNSTTEQTSDDDTEIPLIHGERVNTRCILQGSPEIKGVKTEIVRIRYEENPDATCDLTLISGIKTSDANNVIYESTENDPCCLLSDVSKFSVVYTAEVSMKQHHRAKDSLSLPLGIVAVDWLPRPLDIVDEAKTIHMIDGHGPLAPTNAPSTIRFLGPTACIDYAPFGTKFHCVPSTPRLGIPFEVTYHIKNKTNIYQKINVLLDGEQQQSGIAGGGTNSINSASSSDILICGMVKGDLCLSPSETQSFSYTAVATRSGRTFLPSLSISSTRYSSWVVDEAAEKARPLFVLP